MKVDAETLNDVPSREIASEKTSDRIWRWVIRITALVATLALVVIAFQLIQITRYQRQQACYADIATHASVASQNGGEPRDVGISDGTPAKCRLLR